MFSVFSLLLCLFVTLHNNLLFADIIYQCGDIDNDSIEHCFEQPLFINDVTFKSDIPFTSEEFFYLLGIEPHSFVTAEQLRKGINYLKKKKIFESITVYSEKIDSGASLHITLTGFWIFKKIKFHGILSGKDAYYQYYALESGQQFDIALHEQSLRTIEQTLQHDGYLDSNLSDYLEYDRSKKQVIAHIYITSGIRFVIDTVDISIQDQKKTTPEIKLCEKIKKEFGLSLKHCYYSLDLINKQTSSLKKYLTKRGYLNATVAFSLTRNPIYKTIAINFLINLGPKKRFVFFGNHYFSKQQLLDHILIFGRSIYLLPLSMLAEEILQAYQKKGFWRCTVDQGQEDDSYFFIINEGPRALIQSIEIKGANYVSEKVAAKKHFSRFLRHHVFDADLLKESISSLISWYKQQGFWDIAVLKQEFNPLNRANVYRFSIIIDEGKQRFLNEIIIEGHERLLKKPFFSKYRNHMPFDLAMIEEQKRWLIEYFQKKGYLYVKVQPEYNELDTFITVRWKIFLGQSVKFGKTIITGNQQCAFRTLIDRLGYQEGYPWNKELLNRSFQELHKWGIFETIHAYPDTIDHPEEEKAVIVKLNEDDPFELRIRAGFQQVSKNLTFRSGTTYKLGSSLLYKNPTAAGDILHFDADVTRFYRNILLEYNRPWNFSKPILFTAKAYSTFYIQPVFVGTEKPLYQATQHGFLVGFHYCGEHFDIGSHVGIEGFKTSHVSVNLARAINFDPRLIDKYIPYFFWEPNVLIDYLDNKLNPTRGILSVLSFKVMAPFDLPRAVFVKLLGETSLFFPLDPLVLALHVRVGHIFNQDFKDIMPTDRFYLGGSNSLRGYCPDLAPPLGIFIDENGKRCLVPRGGRSMFNGNIEIRFPIIWQLHGAIFQDFGILVNNSWHNIKGGFLASTGFGLRYLTPIGPLRFDIGWKWKKRDPDESAYAWFLTLGYAF